MDVIEAALRRYPGRALINSISGESGKTDRLLALAKKYGAMFILLPLSDKGLPENLEEKIAIIEEVSQKAYKDAVKKVIGGYPKGTAESGSAGIQFILD